MSTASFDIIMLALPRWDGQYASTAYSLATALSAHTRVFYIDNPFTLKDYWKERHSARIRRRQKALLQGKDVFVQPDPQHPRLIAATPRLTLPINWAPVGGIYNALSTWNDRRVYPIIPEIIRTYGVKRYVFINSFNPLFGRHFPKAFRPDLTVYHSVDDISKSAYIAKHGTRLEAAAVREADFTVVTSKELQRLKSAQTSHPVYYLPNAAHVALFQRAWKEKLERPAELAQVPEGRKVIVYVGNICHRLDYTLLVKIATVHHDKTLLMVGPLSNNNYKKAGLDQLPNVIFTGSKTLEQLPAYLQHSHCGIIPFLCNDLTRSIYPLKINEYLSAGKPVVTTNFSEDIATFGEVASVSTSHEAFVDNISRALERDDSEQQQRRVTYASANNWTARAEQLMAWMQTHLTQTA